MRKLTAVLSVATIGLATMNAATPVLADPSLAGVVGLTTNSHGQAFCTDKAELQALLRASIAEAPVGIGAFPDCVYVADGAVVSVLEDLSPGTRVMHVVRARAAFPLGAVEGYTYSVGLGPYP